MKFRFALRQRRHIDLWGHDRNRQFDSGSCPHKAGNRQFDSGACPHKAGNRQFDSGSYPHKSGSRRQRCRQEYVSALALHSLSRLLLASVFFFTVTLVSSAISEARQPDSSKPPPFLSYILVKDIRQWVDIDYRYDYSAIDSRRDYGTVASHDLLLEHSYHFGTQYAVMRSKLLMGSLFVDIGGAGEWEKDASLGSDTGLTPTLEYHLDGTFFKDEKYPVQFTSYYTKDMVNRVFSSNYDQDQRGESLSLQYEYPSLMTHLQITNGEGKTSGLTNDRTNSFQQILLNGAHRYQEWCSTSFTLMKGLHDTNSESGDQQDGDSHSLTLLNHLDFTKTKQDLTRYLESEYSYSNANSEYGESGKRIMDEETHAFWEERLHWDLGQALDSGLTYRNSFYDSFRNEINTQSGYGWLRHRLFDNFNTNLSVNHNETQQSFGDNKQIAGDLNFNYHRNLPRESKLNVHLNNSYGITEQLMLSGLAQIIDASFLYDATRFNYLNDFDIDLDTIVIRNKERTIVYDEGIDYIVESVGRQTRIEVPQGSAISDGDQLSIDYEYLTNPDITFANQSTSIGSNLALFDNKYRVTGRVSKGGQELLEGSDQNVNLSDYTEYFGSIATTFSKYYTFSVLYRDYNSNNEIYHTWGPSLEYRRNFNLYRFAAGIDIEQTEYEEITYRDRTSEAGSENSLSGHVNLTKSLTFIPGASWENRANFLILSGRGADSTEVDFNTAIQVAIGKSRIRLEGDLSWEDDNGMQSKDAFVALKFRRWF